MSTQNWKMIHRMNIAISRRDAVECRFDTGRTAVAKTVRQEIALMVVVHLDYLINYRDLTTTPALN